MLDQALLIANRARAQIRRPLGSQARVSISVVDRNGVVLGLVRTRDAPLFGIDVSLQKARTAAFYSGTQAAAELQALPTADYLGPVLVGGVPTVASSVDIGDYVDALRTFLDLPSALADGAYAFSDRAGGNLSRPYFPDGLRSAPPGPLSKPAGQWSPFSTGLQLDLVYNQIIGHVAFAAGLSGVDVAQGAALSVARAPVATSIRWPMAPRFFPAVCRSTVVIHWSVPLVYPVTALIRTT